MESVRSGAFVPGLALAEDAHVPDVPVERLVSDTMMIKDAEGKDLIIRRLYAMRMETWSQAT